MGAKKQGAKKAMGAKKQGAANKKDASRRSEDSEVSRNVPLQAILLADSFTTNFHPITLERPKVLLPLVTIPMISHTLAWLRSAGVKEVYVICCAHSKQVINYLETRGWLSQSKSKCFTVTTIVSYACASAGDALRLIHERNVIHGDFVLISGDTVTNMPLAQVLQQHKDRRKNDNAIMTIVTKSASQIMPHQSEELFMAIDSDTNQLLRYENKADNAKDSAFCVDKSLLAGKTSAISLLYVEDCYIDICSPVVLDLLAENFDYQDLRRDLLNGLLDDDVNVMKYKIFTHAIDSKDYAAKVENFQSYNAISKDIIQRVDQKKKDIIISAMCSKVKIGKNTRILSSVIGKRCSIGSNVSIEGCYIWDNVTIEDGCKLKHAVVCDGVVIKSGAVLEPGVVLSFQVVLGEQCIVPSYSKVSLLQQPIEQDSDDEEEEEETCSASKPNEQLGSGGAGYVWSVSDEEWRNSVAPIPADKLAELMRATEEEEEDQDGNSLTPLEEIEVAFENEVEEILRAHENNLKLEDVRFEVNALRLSYYKQTADCAGAIFYSMMKFALEDSASELVQATTKVISNWKQLLKCFLPDIDEEIEVILKFEEMCSESAMEFSSVFDKVLMQLYDQNVIKEEAILMWDEEKKHADESDRVFVRKAKDFIQRLRNAEDQRGWSN